MRRHVLALLAATSLTAAVGGSAFAADLGRQVYKAPPAPMVPTWSWAGFYGGFNVGGSIGSNKTTATDNAVPALGLTSDTSVTGFIGGGQLGYNWMLSPLWVFGFETDFQGSTQKGTASASIGTDTLRVEDKLDWFGTVRARLGFVTGGDTLWYATGGFAYGRVGLSTAENFGPTFLGASVNSTKTGWTVGGGVETRLWNSNWTAKLEYLYMDLGTQSVSVFDPVSGFATSASTKTRDNIVRVGLNYKFW
jgi:outer membrane immunogenic protein